MGCTNSTPIVEPDENNQQKLSDKLNHSVKDAKSKGKGNARNVKNVFAPKIDDSELVDYKPPNFDKIEQEITFLHDSLANNFIFQHLTEKELKIIIKAFEKVSFQENDIIIEQGDEKCKFFYVVYHGECGFKVDGNVVGNASSGTGFGELALLYSAPRAATVYAKAEAVDCFRVDQKSFRYVLQSHNVRADHDKIAALEKVSFLKNLEPYILQKLGTAMTLKNFKQGDYICKKGEAGDAFYILHEGRVDVTNISAGGSHKFDDTVMVPGEFFGERALIKHEPRAANVIGKTDGVVYSIDKLTFESVLGNVSDLILRAQDKSHLSSIHCIHETLLPKGALDLVSQLIMDKTFKEGEIIMTGGKNTEPALYLVRSGSIKVRDENGVEHVVTDGGFFGDHHMTADAEEETTQNKEQELGMSSKLTVTSLTDSICGMLKLIDCRAVFDTKKIGKGSKNSTFAERINLQLSDLRKHRILGEGTFGQVWLVTHDTKCEDNSENKKKKKKKLTNLDGIVPFALKIQSKLELVEQGQAKSAMKEVEIMKEACNSHPLLLHLERTYQDKKFVYMLLQFLQGGELFQQLGGKHQHAIDEGKAQFYAAGILDGLSFLHRHQICYRDLKPENVLIDSDGYPMVIDFGFAKYIPKKTYTFCGTPLYIAPEVVLNRGHSVGVDHWSLGILIYEMMTGDNPFYEFWMDQLSLFRAISTGKMKKTRAFKKKPIAEMMINALLTVDPAKRIGNLAGGENDIKNHEWFENIDFEKLRNKSIPAPWTPKVKNLIDDSNIQKSTSSKNDKTKNKYPPIREEDEIYFKDF